MKKLAPFIKIAASILFLVLSACTQQANKNADNNKDQADLGIQNMAIQNIGIDELPVSILNFIAGTHAGYEIKSASTARLCNGEAVIDVHVENDSKESYSLIFTTVGEYVQKEHEIDLFLSPQALQRAVKEKFPEYQASQVAREIELDNEHLNYRVDFHEDNKGTITKKTVIFDEFGNIVCER